MTGAGDSPEELATWLEQAWRQLRPSGKGGYARPAVDGYVADLLERLRSKHLDPYEIRTAQFPPTPWPPTYNPADVLRLRDELAERVERSRSVSSEAAFEPAEIPQAALDLAQRIKLARFRVSRRAGYDQREVDQYLVTLERALRRGESLDSQEVRARQFRVRRLAPGYHPEDVRQLLEVVAQYADSAC